MKAKLKKEYENDWQPNFLKGVIYEFERVGEDYLCKKDSDSKEHTISASLFKKQFRRVYSK